MEDIIVHSRFRLSESGRELIIGIGKVIEKAEDAVEGRKHAEARVKELELQVEKLAGSAMENALLKGANRRGADTVQHLSGQASELTKLCNEQRELLAKGAQEVEFLKGTIRDAEQHHDYCRLRCGALERILRRYITLDDSELDSAIAAEIELHTKLGKGEPSVA